ncbi:hypothetical protein HYU12_04995 [Candidatus Woesearchaeota archaeon]|nr:hypothetical protein [Candidatus Woesearchaeota archaeon]
MVWKKRHVDIAGLTEDVIEFGPKAALSEKGLRLLIKEAEEIASRLQARGISIQPYDIPFTYHVWQSSDGNNVPYRRLAVKEFVNAVSLEKRVNCTTVEGFRELIPELNAERLRKTPINAHGTTLGTLVRDYRISDLVIDLVDNDGEFSKIRRVGLAPHDFATVPQNYLTDKKGKPTDNARRMTGLLIAKVAELNGVQDYLSPSGFALVAPHLTALSFKTLPINIWETTTGSLLHHAYSDSPYHAVRDWAEHHHPELLSQIAYRTFLHTVR